MTFLVLQSVCKRFGAVTALHDIRLSVPQGSRVAILGPSGSGKTTLLRVVAGFEPPDAGRITLAGDVLADGRSAMPAHRRGVGVVAQDGALFPHLSVRDNIGFGLQGAAAGQGGRVAGLMRLVELDSAMLDRRPAARPGGQQPRGARARAMARQPRLMLLDEPFSALDTALRASTRRAVSEVLLHAGITTVLVTHDQAEALSFADQVAVMREGRLLQVGAPQDVYFHPVSREVAEFLGDAVIMAAELASGTAACALGPIRVDDGQRAGWGTVMLRPEQISLEPAMAGEPGVPACSRPPCIGEILEVEFAGAVCTYVVRMLHPGPGSTGPLVIRQPSNRVLDVGATVRVTVSGHAHVFAVPG